MAVEEEEYLLTTIDNPWNPFTHWDEWYVYDQAKGYDTPGFLARVSRFSFDLSDTDQELAIKEAIDEIVKENVLGIYRKVTENGSIII